MVKWRERKRLANDRDPERVLKGRRVVKALRRVMKSELMGLKVCQSVPEGIIHPSVVSGGETWVWNTRMTGKESAVKKGFLKVFL